MVVHVQTVLQTKIYEMLTGDVTLMDLVDGVFDFVPDNEAFPYVTIGLDEQSDFSTHTDNGFVGFIQIDVWSRSPGKKETKDIQNRIYELLHPNLVTLTGFKVNNFRCDLTRIEKDPDGITHHGIQRFNTLIGGL